MKHYITGIEPGSIAEAMEIAPGDVLLSVNGQKIGDVLDYRFAVADARLAVEIEKPDGDIWELDIEKEERDDLGLIFEHALMDAPKRCRNKCVFCFIDQLPPGLRETLYFKDDDPRFSFLTGNYITLTNLTPDEIRRIARYHLSPLHISVHAADPEVRRQLIGNPHAGNLQKALKVFNDAGIALHFQIVLCRGLNDGAVLDDTIRALLKFRPGAQSCSVVPVGLTRYREGLHPLLPYTQKDAARVIKQVERWQRLCRKRIGSSFVFAADEFYLKAGRALPLYKRYEDFPQLENGVGLMALFERQFLCALRKDADGNAGKKILRGLCSSKQNRLTVYFSMGIGKTHVAKSRSFNLPAEIKTAPTSIGIVTGRAAGTFLRKLAASFMKKYPTVRITVFEIDNTFFGPEVDVAGLLTGRDIIAQLSGRMDKENISTLFLPRSVFRSVPSGEKNPYVLLDDVTRADIKKALGVSVKVGAMHGGRFYRQLAKNCQKCILT